MREHKFKAWHRERKCWLDSVTVYGDGSWSGSLFEDAGEVGGYDERECDLVEFTGLKDKNGKEIYEGDIVKEKQGYYGETPYRVAWQPIGTIGFCLEQGLKPESYTRLSFLTGDIYEVIGNIMENPELLKEHA